MADIGRTYSLSRKAVKKDLLAFVAVTPVDLAFGGLRQIAPFEMKVVAVDLGLVPWYAISHASPPFSETR
jgi:hypothetical protein